MAEEGHRFGGPRFAPHGRIACHRASPDGSSDNPPDHREVSRRSGYPSGQRPGPGRPNPGPVAFPFPITHRTREMCSMMKPIIGVVTPYSELAYIVQATAPQDDAVILQRDGDLDEGVKAAKELVERGADVIISRGGTAL